jgi:hypothetical protein
VRASLDSFKEFTLPNEPIAGFSLLDGSFHATWNARFGEITRDNFIEEITAFLAAIELPKLSAKNLRHDHLVIYHHVSELRELARNALSEAMARGYPHAFNVIAQTHEIAPVLMFVHILNTWGLQRRNICELSARNCLTMSGIDLLKFHNGRRAR